MRVSAGMGLVSSFRAPRVAFATIASLTAISLPTAQAQITHTVEPGESLWSIASVNGLGVEELAVANGLPADALLVSGTTIEIPPVASVPTGTGITGTGACVWDCSSAAHPHPTDEVVSTGVIAEEASEYGMLPSLAQAIAWEESGFDNSVVSPAGARGTMQIIPDTWDFVNEVLVDEPLSSVSASHNVEAGVAYLHHLYHLTGNREATVAAYFQGPNRDTLLPETQAYVSEVLKTQAEFAAAGG